jgi:hypothetical protein
VVSFHVPAALPPYPLDRKLGGPQSRSGRRGEEKILDPRGLESKPSGVQPVDSRHCKFVLISVTHSYIVHLVRRMQGVSIKRNAPNTKCSKTSYVTSFYTESSSSTAEFKQSCVACKCILWFPTLSSAPSYICMSVW